MKRSLYLTFLIRNVMDKNWPNHPVYIDRRMKNECQKEDTKIIEHARTEGKREREREMDFGAGERASNLKPFTTCIDQ